MQLDLLLSALPILFLNVRTIVRARELHAAAAQAVINKALRFNIINAFLPTAHTSNGLAALRLVRALRDWFAPLRLVWCQPLHLHKVLAVEEQLMYRLEQPFR